MQAGLPPSPHLEPQSQPIQNPDSFRSGHALGGEHAIEKHGALILSLVDATTDLTLEEFRAALAKRGVAVGYGGLWRSFDRRGISIKKTAHAAER